MKLRRTIKKICVMQLSGGRFRYFGTGIHFPKEATVIAEACNEGIYERENLDLLTAALPPESWYFDVGANLGLLSVPILKRLPSVSCVSLEPSPNVYQCLSRTHADSGYGTRWRLEELAVGAKKGSADFFTSAEGGGAFDGLSQTGRVGGISSRMVRVTTLDAIWRKYGRPKIGAVKIDVEGGELSVLEGGTEAINDCRPVILTEWNAINLRASGVEPEALLSWAARSRYRVFAAPLVIPVDSAIALKLQMCRTESFVLLPT